MRRLSNIKTDSYAICTNCMEIFIDDFPLLGSYACPNCKNIYLLRNFDILDAAEEYLDALKEELHNKGVIMDKRKIVVYISGAYTGDDGGRSINKNILLAREYAIKLWELGYSVICPHLNTQFFERDCKCEYEDYLQGDLEIIRRCDCIFILPNYTQSKGAQKEIIVAREEVIPEFHTIEEIEQYYEH